MHCEPWPCSDDWRIRLVLPILWLIDALLRQRPLAERLFNSFRSPDNIRKILQVLHGVFVGPLMPWVGSMLVPPEPDAGSSRYQPWCRGCTATRRRSMMSWCS